MLRSIATRLKGALRQSDTMGRYGGDEFVVVLSEIERRGHAALVAGKLLEALAGPHRVDGQTLGCTASLGVSVPPDHGRDLQSLIAAADAAMYQAKRDRPGSFRMFDAGMERGVTPCASPLSRVSG